MGTERKRKVSLFDVVDESSVSTKLGHAGTTNSTATAAANPSINRWTGRPYSARYLEILQKHRTLPVWQQKDDFLAVLRDNQTLILVGETGSGKTTQMEYHHSTLTPKSIDSPWSVQGSGAPICIFIRNSALSGLTLFILLSIGWFRHRLLYNR
uniref:RNA helicase n=1 Tax=Oryza nivara TaxID=4536 RepID=A0A0E0I883_ORYNI